MRASGRLFLFVLAFVLAGAAQAGQIYKCVKDGRTVFQEQPCAAGDGGAIELSPINSYGKGAAPAAGRRAAETTAPTMPAPEAAPVASKNAAGWYTGYKGYVAALNESERSGAPMLVYFYTNWCPHCRHLDKAVLTDAGVVSTLKPLIKVRVNADGASLERALFGQHQAGGVPLMVVIKGKKTRQVAIEKEPALFARAVRSVLPSVK